MSAVRIIDFSVSQLVSPEYPQVVFDAKDYELRLEGMTRKMKKKGLTHAVVYADKEHFANMLYLTGFEPRFEEALFVVSAEGERTLFLGNECMAYSQTVPFPIARKRYQHFSLQGQPRESLVSLASLLNDCGINAQSKTGLVGFKYFHEGDIEEAPFQHDVPAYIVSALQKASGHNKIPNITHFLTGQEDGLRLTLSAKDIVWYEHVANKVSNSMIGMLTSLKTGMRELDLGEKARLDASPFNAFPMINFGMKSIGLGLKSPGPSVLHKNDPVGVAFSLRGALCARVGMGGMSEHDWDAPHQGMLERFFKPHWLSVATWLESVKVGAAASEVCENVMAHVGDPEFGLYLNTGHHIEQDEWVNTPFTRDAKHRLKSGYYLQSDIIACSQKTGLVSICEDGVVIADLALRAELKASYPKIFARMVKRQARLREVLGIQIHEDSLPMSDLCGFFMPFALESTRVFAKGA